MNPFARGVIGIFSWLFSLGFTLVIIAGVVGIVLFNHYSKDLPDYTQLSQYDPPTVTRLYAGDGKLLAEYATEKRVFVPLSAVPLKVREAFISAEDKNFYEHEGIDFTGLLRAVRDNIINYGQGKSLVGGSTITQQVVKNFLLSNEKSIERKIKEAILATRISRVYSKDKILELYLNEIYLGLGSYGVAAAAQNYFNKSMDELTVAEAALLAAQPKAPAEFNPKKNYARAKERRDWVIDRMLDGGFITAEEDAEAKNTPIVLRDRDASDIARADFFAEEVRRELADMYGADVLYAGGLVVKTTLDPELQQFADRALRKALVEYDRRRGYRGPLAHLPAMGAKAYDWKEQLVRLARENDYHLFNQRLALITSLDERKANIIFADESTGTLPMSVLGWTRRVIADGELGPEVKKPGDIFRVGDVVIVAPLTDAAKKELEGADQKKAWNLQQIPEINGAIVVLDPHTGRVLAMSGGYAYGGTEFNRATQARRQPGSAFKPFVYTAGLENGFTPSTIILDAPVEMSQGAGLPNWKPQNYHDDYLGPTTMRVGLEKSRNTMTVRMAQMIGLNKVLAISKRFGIYDNPPPNFSIVLGSAETTLLRLANAYGILANGGKRIDPHLIERIDDRHGTTILRRDTRVCRLCHFDTPEKAEQQILPPIPADERELVVDPRIDYQIVSMLQGVTTRGTGARAKEIGKIVGGKTGTTNDSHDTWFVGFSPDLVAGVFVGYDKPRTLGKKETGASVALPAFIDFMKSALADVPNKPFRIPRGIQLVKVDLHSGQQIGGELDISLIDPTAPPVSSQVITEAFITGPPIYIPGVTPPPKDWNSESMDMPVKRAMPSPVPYIPPSQQEIPPPPLGGTGALY